MGYFHGYDVTVSRLHSHEVEYQQHWSQLQCYTRLHQDVQRSIRLHRDEGQRCQERGRQHQEATWKPISSSGHAQFNHDVLLSSHYLAIAGIHDQLQHQFFGLADTLQSMTVRFDALTQQSLSRRPPFGPPLPAPPGLVIAGGGPLHPSHPAYYPPYLPPLPPALPNMEVDVQRPTDHMGRVIKGKQPMTAMSPERVGVAQLPQWHPDFFEGRPRPQRRRSLSEFKAQHMVPPYQEPPSWSRPTRSESAESAMAGPSSLRDQLLSSHPWIGQPPDSQQEPKPLPHRMKTVVGALESATLRAQHGEEAQPESDQQAEDQASTPPILRPVCFHSLEGKCWHDIEGKGCQYPHVYKKDDNQDDLRDSEQAQNAARTLLSLLNSNEVVENRPEQAVHQPESHASNVVSDEQATESELVHSNSAQEGRKGG